MYHCVLSIHGDICLLFIYLLHQFPLISHYIIACMYVLCVVMGAIQYGPTKIHSYSRIRKYVYRLKSANKNFASHACGRTYCHDDQKCHHNNMLIAISSLTAMSIQFTYNSFLFWLVKHISGGALIDSMSNPNVNDVDADCRLCSHFAQRQQLKHVKIRCSAIWSSWKIFPSPNDHRPICYREAANISLS